MKRREFIAALGGAAAWPLVAQAQQPAMPVIGFISSRSPGESASVVAAFQQGLSDTGYVEGKNVKIEHRWAEGHFDRLPAIAADLVSRQVAVIIAAGGDRPALAAKAATSTIPIVFTGSDFPVKVGLVASLSRPGGNVTGASLFTSELEVKKLALLRELIPNAPLIAMLVNPINPSAETDIEDVQKAAAAVGQQVSQLRASSEQEIDTAFETVVQQRANALLVAHDPIFLSRRDQFVALAARHKVPAIYEFREFAVLGGLMSYVATYADADGKKYLKYTVEDQFQASKFIMEYGFGKPVQPIANMFPEQQQRQVLEVRWLPPRPDDHSKCVDLSKEENKGG